MKKKIMMLNPGEICYGSLIGFMKLLQNAFSRIGLDTVIPRISSVEELKEEAKECMALVMINGNTAVKAADEYVLDMLDIPIVDFIVDHPRHHREYLSTKLKNLYVVCLDEDQVGYIRKYFPHVKGAMPAWLYGGEFERNLSFEERDLGILFSGSYTDEKNYLLELEKKGNEIMSLGAETIEMLLQDNSLLIEQALMQVYINHGLDIEDELFSILDNEIGMYVDFFLRQYYRHVLVAGLVEKGVPLTLCGVGWEKLNLPSNLVTLIPSVPFEKTPEIISRSKVSLSINPWFKKGLHDRVVTSMMNHSICATDSSMAIERDFKDGENIIIYDLKNPPAISDRLINLVNDRDEWEKMSQNGYQTVKTKYDFCDVAKGIWEMISE